MKTKYENFYSCISWFDLRNQEGTISQRLSARIEKDIDQQQNGENRKIDNEETIIIRTPIVCNPIPF